MEGCAHDSDSCQLELYCKLEEHTHTDECGSDCAKTEHTHIDDCYQDCVIYQHKKHSSTGCCRKSGCDHASNTCVFDLFVLPAKYNADISSIWPTSEHVEAWKDLGWLSSTVYYQKWGSSSISRRTEMIASFCASSTSKLTRNALTTTTKPGNYTGRYLVESLDQTPGDGKVLYSGVYYENDPRYTQGNLPSRLTSAKVIVGMKNKKVDTTTSTTVTTFYYTRNSYNLIFVNSGVQEASESVKYGAWLGQYNYTPEPPASAEENSVTFAGWYTTQICADGTKVDFTDADTMPARDLFLYAKWVPTEWNVTTYLDKAQTLKLDERTVSFGSMIAEPDYTAAQANHSEYKDLIFAGWYYVDEEGNEARFDFNTMAIKRDYVIYAKWTSHIPVEYVVRYVVETADGEYIEIATPTKGVSLAGVSKSFVAKAGEELLAAYRGYLPTQRSLTKEMSSDSSQNELRFIYKTVESVTYTVKHVFKCDDFLATAVGSDTLELETKYTILCSDSSFSGKLIVRFDANLQDALMAQRPDDYAELWEIIVDLSPDAYQKELYFVADSTDPNEAVFHWEGRGVLFMYQVVHYYQNIENDDYSFGYSLESLGSFDENGDATITAKVPTEHGFVFNGEKSTVTMAVKQSDSGMVERILEIYYDREMMSYKVEHIYGSHTLVETIDQKVKYKSTVTVYAKEFAGYTVATVRPQSEIISYDGQIIRFKYNPLTTIFNYQVMGDVGGLVSSFQEVVGVAENAEGSIPSPSKGFVFDGWYADEAGTVKVNDAWVGEDNKLTPVPSLTDTGKAYYFYAKFIPTSLTISHSDIPLSSQNQTFLYEVSWVDGSTTRTVSVVVENNGSAKVVGFPVGTEVTVKPVNDWAWRSPDAEEESCEAVITSDKKGATVTFTYGVSGDAWLGNDVYGTSLVGN